MYSHSKGNSGFMVALLEVAMVEAPYLGSLYEVDHKQIYCIIQILPYIDQAFTAIQ